MDDVDFADLIRRAQKGEDLAIRNLLKEFEQEIRIMVRVRLPRSLRSQFDSMDFVQSIWKSVFVGPTTKAVAEVYESPVQFKRYLAGIARNKVNEEFRRRTRTIKYDVRREEPIYLRKGSRDVPLDIASNDPSPSEAFLAHEQLDKMLAGRSSTEVRIIQLRRDGMTFEEIAENIGISERSVRRLIQSLRECLEDDSCL